MKSRFVAALLALSSPAVFAQDVDVDVDVPDMPAMNVKMRVQTQQPAPEAPPPPNQGPRPRQPPPQPGQVIGAENFDVLFELKPRETLRLVSPEGAHVEIWGDDGAYLGGYEVPCEVPARAGMYYRVVMTANGGLVLDRKIEVRQYYRTIVAMRVAQPVLLVQPSVGMVDFPALVEAVKAESFSDAKLDVVRAAEGGLTVEQLGQLVDLFSFSSDQLKLVELAHRRLVDRQNAFKLYSHFTFDGDKKKVKAILGK